jgi:hypothetical protein
MAHFTKWKKVHGVTKKEVSAVAEALETNFCLFGIPRKVHNDQGRNFEAHLMQEVLHHLGVAKTRLVPLHKQSDSMLKRYVKTVMQHLRKVVTSHQRDWNEGLPIFLLSYTAYTYDTYDPLAWYSEKSFACSATCCSGLPSA